MFFARGEGGGGQRRANYEKCVLAGGVSNKKLMNVLARLSFRRLLLRRGEKKFVNYSFNFCATNNFV